MHAGVLHGGGEHRVGAARGPDVGFPLRGVAVLVCGAVELHCAVGEEDSRGELGVFLCVDGVRGADVVWDAVVEAVCPLEDVRPAKGSVGLDEDVEVVGGRQGGCFVEGGEELPFV